MLDALDLRILRHIAGTTEYREAVLPARVIFGVAVGEHVVPAGSSSNDGDLTASNVADDLQDPGAVAACYALTRAGYLESGRYRLTPWTQARIGRDERWREVGTWTPLQVRVVEALREMGPLDRDGLAEAIYGNTPEQIPGDLKRAIADLVRFGDVASARNLWLSAKGRKALDTP